MCSMDYRRQYIDRCLYPYLAGRIILDGMIWEEGEGLPGDPPAAAGDVDA